MKLTTERVRIRRTARDGMITVETVWIAYPANLSEAVVDTRVRRAWGKGESREAALAAARAAHRERLRNVNGL